MSLSPFHSWGMFSRIEQWLLLASGFPDSRGEIHQHWSYLFLWVKYHPPDTTRQGTLSWSPASVRQGGETGVGWETSFPFSPLNPEDGRQSSTWSLAGGGQALTRVFPALRQPLPIPLTGGTHCSWHLFCQCLLWVQGWRPGGTPGTPSISSPSPKTPWQPTSFLPHVSPHVPDCGVRPGPLTCGRDGATPCGCNRRSPLLKVCKPPNEIQYSTCLQTVIWRN